MDATTQRHNLFLLAFQRTFKTAPRKLPDEKISFLIKQPDGEREDVVHDWDLSWHGVVGEVLEKTEAVVLVPVSGILIERIVISGEYDYKSKGITLKVFAEKSDSRERIEGSLVVGCV